MARTSASRPISPPSVAIADRPDVTVTATLAFGTDLQTNGSVRSLDLAKPAGTPVR